MIGLGILAAIAFVLTSPLWVGVLIASGRLRYRAWLAGVALLASLALVTISADYFYNLGHWSQSRSSVTNAILYCLVVVPTPLFLAILILKRSRRKLALALAIAGAMLLSGRSIVQTVQRRSERDRTSLETAIRPLSPATGWSFVPVWQGHAVVANAVRGGAKLSGAALGSATRDAPEPIFVMGHIPAQMPVTLLSTPLAEPFRPRHCTGLAAVYHPPVPDPAVPGNLTEIAELAGCDSAVRYRWAVLDRTVTTYASIPFVPEPRVFDSRVLAKPEVAQAFRDWRYTAADFDLRRAITRRAVADLLPTAVFLTDLQPLTRPRDIYPCTDPALLVTAGQQESAAVVVPYCATAVAFRLDDDLFLAARSQLPSPPGSEAMNPEFTEWLFRVRPGKLEQIWPAR